MALHFLDFDYSEDEDGIATWDALASIPARRLPELLAELERILAWAHAEFGTPEVPLEHGGPWQYDLQCESAGFASRELHFDPDAGRLQPVLPPMAPEERVTISFSLAAERSVSEAFSEQFLPG